MCKKICGGQRFHDRMGYVRKRNSETISQITYYKINSTGYKPD